MQSWSEVRKLKRPSSAHVRLIAAVGVATLLLASGGAAAYAQPTTTNDAETIAPTSTQPEPCLSELVPTSTTSPTITATPSPGPVMPCETSIQDGDTAQVTPSQTTSTTSEAITTTPTTSETITPTTSVPRTEFATIDGIEQANIVETLTGTEDLAPADSLPLYLPKAALRAAVLSTNQIGGVLYYRVPDSANIDAPAMSTHTVLYSSQDGTADAFQATNVGQVRQILAIPANTQRVERGVQLNGGITLVKKTDQTYEVLDNEGRPVGYIDNLQARTADGSDVSATIALTQTELVVELQDVPSAPVYVTWSFAAGSSAAEVVLE